MADRYTYVPHIGLFILLAWALRDLWRGLPRTRPAIIALASAALAACAILTWVQVGYWHDSVTLFKHAVAVTAENWQGHLNLALSLSKQGRAEEARVEYREVVRIKPGYGASHLQFGVTRSVGGRLEKTLAGAGGPVGAEAEAAFRQGEELAAAGRPAESIPAYEVALGLDPGSVEARYGLANALAQAGRMDEAIAGYERLLADNPGHWAGRNNLGVTLLRSQRPAEAREQFQESLRLFPRNAVAHGNLGLILIDEGRYEDAMPHLEEALRIRPDDTRAMASYAEALLRVGRTEEAKRWCREALRLAPGNTRAQDTLREAGGRP